MTTWKIFDFFFFHFSPSKFTVHTIIMDSNQLSILNVLDNSLSLLDGHVSINSVLVSTVYETDQEHLFELPASKIKV